MKSRVYLVQSIGVLAVVVSSLFLLGCSPSKSDSNDNQDSYSFPNEGATDSALEKWKVNCRSYQECPESIGQLVVRTDSTTVSVCTAFLVDQKTVVTNQHCVADLTTIASCSNKAEIVFPETQTTRALTVKCGRLLDRTEKATFTDPDLALIELDTPVHRASLKIDGSGVLDGEILSIYKVNPGPDNTSDRNTLEKQNCRAITKPFFLPNFSQPLDPTVAFTDCEIRHGNSGSPMVGASGGVKAVAFGNFEEDQTAISGSLEKSVFQDPELIGRKFNVATNASCFGLSPLSIQTQNCLVPSAVERDLKDKQERDAQNGARARASLQNFVNWSVQNSALVVFQAELVKGQGGDLWYRAKPLCVQPYSQWKSLYSKKAMIGTWPQESGALSISAPGFSLKRGYDSSLRVRLEVPVKPDRAMLIFSPKELSQNKGGSFSIQRTDQNSSAGLKTVDLVVPPCKQVVTPALIQEISNR
jgi:hypothetical protein